MSVKVWRRFFGVVLNICQKSSIRRVKKGQDRIKFWKIDIRRWTCGGFNTFMVIYLSSKKIKKYRIMIRNLSQLFLFLKFWKIFWPTPCIRRCCFVKKLKTQNIKNRKSPKKCNLKPRIELKVFLSENLRKKIKTALLKRQFSFTEFIFWYFFQKT